MPEYGRHVQRMVEYTIAVEDKVKRNSLAETIVQVMNGLAPELKDNQVGKQIYWDHLAIISDFQLDVDYPSGTITQDQLNAKVEKPAYKVGHSAYRYYGDILHTMIKKVSEMPLGKDRSEMEYFIALQMKRSYMTWNSELVEDIKIFKDLYVLSDGQILLTPEECKIILNPNTLDRVGKQKNNRKSQAALKLTGKNSKRK